jgi:hypothetical protein
LHRDMSHTIDLEVSIGVPYQHGSAKWCARREDKCGFRLLLAPKSSQTLIHRRRVGGTGRSVLDPPDVQHGGQKVDLILAQVHQFGNPKPVPKSHQDHRGIAVAP